MNYITTLITIVLVTSLNGQKRKNIDSYIGDDGFNYRVGQTISLNEGSDTDGTFNYVKTMGIDGNTERAGTYMANRKIKILRIREVNTKTRNDITLNCRMGITSVIVDLKSAIRNCEIGPCKKNAPVVQSSKYDRLEKVKKLYDNGVLTKDEYESEKNKLLNE